MGSGAGCECHTLSVYWRSTALDTFTGTVLAVSHDRAFLRTMDRFLMVLHDGAVLSLPSYDSALEALIEPAEARDVRLAKVL